MFKLTELDTRVINYFGKEISVPKKKKASYIATDKIGMIYAFCAKPVVDLLYDVWTVTPEHEATWDAVGFCEYNGDWKESLMEIENV